LSNGFIWEENRRLHALKGASKQSSQCKPVGAQSLSASDTRARSLSLIPHCHGYRGPRINLCASRPQSVFLFGRSTHPPVALSFTAHPLRLHSLLLPPPLKFSAEKPIQRGAPLKCAVCDSHTFSLHFKLLLTL
jgi:hypothetical protein